MTVSRRDQILRVAARLFAERGYQSVGMDDIGAAVGISGPALYKHFRGKEAMLTELLVDISEQLLARGRERAAIEEPGAALAGLISGQVEFALRHPDLITLHDHALNQVPVQDRHRIRRLQRAYVEIWVEVALRAYPTWPDDRHARAAVHATFGLINSTPHTLKTPQRILSPVLGRMAGAALSAAATETVGAGSVTETTRVGSVTDAPDPA
ncbi:TetR/AcrR family transcriptional regulator [Streptomyces sp. SID3343]|uniref:TetR/AcrR family transcriptional regulator n=1 Tax=Streptomyces sp. SID3343 TaxID=2690260 RepID=UPI00136CFDDB|nr:TetR/AcrR family transcriptional regulator [Streptomyces sp. SID3343]MYW05721.1 TetR family transcriptional regulator [Streptomyces sp. SID3343]